jgi:hypothetical protein
MLIHSFFFIFDSSRLPYDKTIPAIERQQLNIHRKSENDMGLTDNGILKECAQKIINCHVESLISTGRIAVIFRAVDLAKDETDMLKVMSSNDRTWAKG